MCSSHVLSVQKINLCVTFKKELDRAISLCAKKEPVSLSKKEPRVISLLNGPRDTVSPNHHPFSFSRVNVWLQFYVDSGSSRRRIISRNT